MYSKIYQINSDGSIDIEVFSQPGVASYEGKEVNETITGNIKNVYDKEGNLLYSKSYHNKGKIPSYNFAEPFIPNYATYSDRQDECFYYLYKDRKSFVKHFKFKGPEFICPDNEVITTRGFGLNILDGKIIAVKEYIITREK